MEAASHSMHRRDDIDRHDMPASVPASGATGQAEPTRRGRRRGVSVEHRRTSRLSRRRRLLWPLGILAVVVVSGVAGVTTVMESAPEDVRRVLPARMAVGATHTQYSADPWHPKGSVKRAVSVLDGSIDIQNQALMGWGAENPMPSPGVYDWESLDERVGLMRRSRRSVLSITLCGAPDWMKGGKPGQTDWDDIEKAPLPEHFDDFAALSAEVARRYPDVEYFFVWNELKGFHDEATNDWDMASYTALYNKVYLALKAVRPTVKVGGPYVPMDSWSSPDQASHTSTLRGPWGVVDSRSLTAVEYWLAHNVGADFITVDGQSGTRDRKLITADQVATDKFSAITRWIRQRTPLPIWWAELYPHPADVDAPPDSPRRAQLFLETLVELRSAGAAGVMLWQPEAHPNLNSVALWTSTEQTAGGAPLPLARPMQWLRQQWDAGAEVTAAFSGQTLVLTAPAETATIDASGRFTTQPRPAPSTS